MRGILTSHSTVDIIFCTKNELKFYFENHLIESEPECLHEPIEEEDRIRDSSALRTCWHGGDLSY